MLCSLTSKSVFVTKSASANLALKLLAAKILNSGEEIYFSWLGSLTLFSISLLFVL